MSEEGESLLLEGEQASTASRRQRGNSVSALIGALSKLTTRAKRGTSNPPLPSTCFSLSQSQCPRPSASSPPCAACSAPQEAVLRSQRASPGGSPKVASPQLRPLVASPKAGARVPAVSAAVGSGQPIGRRGANTSPGLVRRLQDPSMTPVLCCGARISPTSPRTAPRVLEAFMCSDNARVCINSYLRNSSSNADVGSNPKSAILLQLVTRRPGVIRLAAGVMGADAGELLITPGSEYVVTASASGGKLRSLAYIALHALRGEWPHLFSTSDLGELELLERARSITASDIPAVSKLVYELVDAVKDSPAAMWLSGLWALLVAKCPDEGVKSLSKSAAAGCSLAASMLARLVQSGKVAEQNTSEATRLYSVASEAGCAGSLVGLGLMHLQGSGAVPKDPSEAARLLSFAAEAGSTEGNFRIAQCMLSGEGVARCPEHAVRHLEVAADRCLPDAQFALATCDRDAVGGLNRDLCACAKLLERAASRGHAQAQCLLGVALLSGEGVAERDPVEASRLFKSASEAGDPLATYYVGVCFEEGHGVRASAVDAARWYRTASSIGCSLADYRLGMMYSTGTGVRKDRDEAVLLLQAAADAGVPGAAEALFSL
eukprot:m51a1_g3542 hypothetical protein (605) ;mRNA; r:984202-986542